MKHLIRIKKRWLTSLLLLTSLLVITLPARAQFKVSTSTPKHGNLTIGSRFLTNFSGFNDNLPFWLHADQYGLYDPHSANGLLTARFYQPVASGKRYSIYASGMMAGRAADRSWAGLPFLSATLNFSVLQLRAGRFSDPLGTNYHPLSSGSMLYSTNAMPVPKIMVKTRGFVDIPYTKGHLQFSAYLSHGWLEHSRYTKNAYLHQKYLYLKVNYKMLEATGGIVHNVQWGGTNPGYGQLPDSFEDYLRVVFSQSADQKSNAPGAEKTNSIGNSVAGYDFNLRVHLNHATLSFYRLFYLEDKVSTQFRSPWDGMWGAAYIAKKSHPLLKAFLYEHINTKRQDSFDFEPRGSANYYNNGVYGSGWTYNNRVLGNPLLLTDGSNRSPIYNNIILAHHFAADGFISPNLQWEIRYTFSRNYGQKNDQIIPGTRQPGSGPIHADLYPLSTLKKINHSFYLSASYTPPRHDRFQFELGLAGDFGQLYDSNRLGVMFGASYRVY